MRAYSIGALIGMCVLTQSGRLLVCACLLNKGAYSQKPYSRGRLLERKRLLEGGSAYWKEEALIGRRELNQIITAWT